MAILEVAEAVAKFPSVQIECCEDPRHTDVHDDDEVVAVIETRYDIYAVCEACLAKIVNNA